MWRCRWVAWITLIFLATFTIFCSCYKGSKDARTGPEDDEDDISPWPCPEGLTWHRCHVNLSCFEDTDEEAMTLCGPGCYCPKRRYLYKEECITKDECPTDECDDGMEWKDCGNHCEELCPSVAVSKSCSASVCYDGCFCKQGLKKYAGKCYEPEDCPKDPVRTMENFLLFNKEEPNSAEENKRHFFLYGSQTLKSGNDL